MNTGAKRDQATLDVPAGPGSFTALDPAEWWCAARTEGPGQVQLRGAYHPGITTATRVHFKGRIYHVTSFDNRDERDIELILHCTEVFD
jgi:head-tail adaptor